MPLVLKGEVEFEYVEQEKSVETDTSVPKDTVEKDQPNVEAPVED